MMSPSISQPTPSASTAFPVPETIGDYYQNNRGSWSNPIHVTIDREPTMPPVPVLTGHQANIHRTTENSHLSNRNRNSFKRGRGLSLAGYTIHKLINENPRPKGTWGYKAWEKIKNGMTYEQLIKAGGRYRDLRHDQLAKRSSSGTL
jgi:hypothetical protein